MRYKCVRDEAISGHSKNEVHPFVGSHLGLADLDDAFAGSYRVRLHVRDEISRGLRNSVTTFQSLQQQRESTLERSAALLATLPPLKALMTSQDTATIQDASGTFWKLAGSQLFVLADRSGKVAALHTATRGFHGSRCSTIAC